MDLLEIIAGWKEYRQLDVRGPVFALADVIQVACRLISGHQGQPDGWKLGDQRRSCMLEIGNLQLAVLMYASGLGIDPIGSMLELMSINGYLPAVEVIQGEDAGEGIFHCPECGVTIGQETVNGGRTLLDMDGIAAYGFHGYCKCGAQVHWDSGEVIMRRLLKRGKKRA